MLRLAKFGSGEINGTEKPNAVKSSDMEFQNFSLTNFRAFYNRMKRGIYTTGTLLPFLHTFFIVSVPSLSNLTLFNYLDHSANHRRCGLEPQIRVVCVCCGSSQ